MGTNNILIVNDISTTKSFLSGAVGLNDSTAGSIIAVVDQLTNGVNLSRLTQVYAETVVSERIRDQQAKDANHGMYMAGEMTGLFISSSLLSSALVSIYGTWRKHLKSKN